MYKVVVRALVRRGIARLNAGDPSMLLRMASPSAEIAFPGDNSWAAMFRPVQKGRAPHATHRGIDECRAFAARFVAEGIQFGIEDIVVNGGPWRTRVVMRAHDFIPGVDGDRYNNRAVAWMELRWGRLVRWEDYEDTQRTSAYDLARASGFDEDRATTS